ncbi:hypothetical protein [Rhodovarius lipocyclicus]|nr:hypothetical protein [Rhodovarius lipocyclicus]
MIATILQSAVLIIIGGGVALAVCALIWMLSDWTDQEHDID